MLVHVCLCMCAVCAVYRYISHTYSFCIHCWLDTNDVSGPYIGVLSVRSQSKPENHMQLGSRIQLIGIITGMKRWRLQKDMEHSSALGQHM